MTTAEYLNDLITAKEDMKSAIEEKGVEVTGGLTSYADAISAIYTPRVYIGINFRGSINMERTGVFDSSAITSMNSFYANLHRLKIAELINTSNVTDMSHMFDWCNSLSSVPLYDTSKVTNMSYMFRGCRNLSTVPNFNTSNVTDMSHMFDLYDYGERAALTICPHFDTSNVIDMSYMFSWCHNLSSVPLFNTSKVTNMSYMFSWCQNLSTVPQFDTSKVTNMSHMFDLYGYYGDAEPSFMLSSVPQFDTSNVTDMSYMFRWCHNLSTVPQFDTSNVTDMSHMFDDCYNLVSIPELDCSNVTNIDSMLYVLNSGTEAQLKELGGFKNLGKQESLKSTLSIYSDISKQSMLNIVNGLYDRAAAGYSSLYINIPNIHELLTDDEVAIATNKGWIVYG